MRVDQLIDKKANYIDAFWQLMYTSNNEILKLYSTKEIIRPLVWKDWKGNGGRMSHKRLAIKYGITEKEVRTILNACKKNL